MINEILGKYENTLENVKHIFYSNCGNNTLFISFAGKVDRYVSATWFYNQYDFLGNFLFLKNDEEGYNTYNEEKYSRLIKYYIDKYSVNNLIMFGPSMGGIASIMYGLKFNANTIISIDPNPINFNYHNLLEQIKSYPNNYDYKNKIFINYTFMNDFNTLCPWTEDIINELKKKNIITILQPFRSTEHLHFIPSKEFLLDIIKANGILKVQNYTETGKWF
jgi:hypothetical protein